MLWPTLAAISTHILGKYIREHLLGLARFAVSPTSLSRLAVLFSHICLLLEIHITNVIGVASVSHDQHPAVVDVDGLVSHQDGADVQLITDPIHSP